MILALETRSTQVASSISARPPTLLVRRTCGRDTASRVFFECEDLARKHGLDLSDALQLHALKEGCASGGILVTADIELAKAARAEGLTVWNCEKEAAPDSPAVDSAT